MVGWPLVVNNNLLLEESPGSTETRCRVTPGGGNPRESATESKPPGRLSAISYWLSVREKNWGPNSVSSGRQPKAESRQPSR